MFDISAQENSDISFIITQCFDFSNDVSSTKRLLQEYKQNLVFHCSGDKCARLIGLLNANLNKQVNDPLRRNALLVLDTLLGQCNAHIFIDNATFWLHCCLKSCDSDPFCSLELQLLENIILSCVNYPDIRRHVSHHILGEFMDKIKFTTESSIEVLHKKVKCIIAFLRHFNEACGSFKTKIISFLNDTLKTHTNTPLVNLTARCYALTTQCGQKGKGNINYVTNWTNQLLILVNTLHHVINDMVENIILEPYKISGQICIGLLNDSNETGLNTIDKYFILLNNFKRISAIMSAMFRTSCSMKKVFDPRDITHLTYRMADFNLKSLASYPETNDTLGMKLILSEVLEHNFQLLRAFIKCASRNLIPYGPVFGAICVQNLGSSQLKCDSKVVIYRRIRKAVYKVLCTWFTVATSSSSIEHATGDLASEIVSDIVCNKENVLLLINNKNCTKSKSSNNDVIGLKDLCYLENKLKVSVCIEAHKTLQNYIRYAVNANLKNYQTLQNAIYSQVAELLPEKTIIENDTLYSHSACRLKLYESLYVVITEPPTDYVTRIADGVHLFTKGMLDPNHKIAKFCSSSLNALRIIIHPRGPTLSIQNIDNKTELNYANSYHRIVDSDTNQNGNDINKESDDEELSISYDGDNKKVETDDNREVILSVDKGEESSRADNDEMTYYNTDNKRIRILDENDISASNNSDEMDNTISTEASLVPTTNTTTTVDNANSEIDNKVERRLQNKSKTSTDQNGTELSVEEMLSDFVDVAYYD